MNDKERHLIDESLKNYISIFDIKKVDYLVSKAGFIEIYVRGKNKEEWDSFTCKDKDAAITFLEGIWVGRKYYERNRPNND